MPGQPQAWQWEKNLPAWPAHSILIPAVLHWSAGEQERDGGDKGLRVQGVPSVGLTMILAVPPSAPILPRQMGFWQKRLGSWARWWNIPTLTEPSSVPELVEHLVLQTSWPIKYRLTRGHERASGRQTKDARSHRCLLTSKSALGRSQNMGIWIDLIMWQKLPKKFILNSQEHESTKPYCKCRWS